MSYDISLGKEDDFNYTYNMAPFFTDHIKVVDPVSGITSGLRALDGLTGKEALKALSEAFNSIHNGYIDADWRGDPRNPPIGAPKFCAKYDAPNGWGSTLGAIVFLGQLMAACARNKKKVVRVS